MNITEKNIDNPDEIANTSNHLFGTIGQLLASDIVTCVGDHLELPKRRNESFYLQYTTSSEILKTIHPLKYKSGGVDANNARAIKEIASGTSRILI